MKNTVLYNNGDHYLIERRFDNGEIKEYVCCSYYDPETDSWSWGHYFQTLTAAGKFFYEEWEHPEEKTNTVWVLNGIRDEGWTPEIYKTKEGALKMFNHYVEEFKDFFGIEPEDFDEEMARFETEDDYVTFWIEEMEVLY